jgi:hypothetical protein
MEQNQLRILDCGLQIGITDGLCVFNPKSAICILKSYLLQYSGTPCFARKYLNFEKPPVAE